MDYFNGFVNKKEFYKECKDKPGIEALIEEKRKKTKEIWLSPKWKDPRLMVERKGRLWAIAEKSENGFLNKKNFTSLMGHAGYSKSCSYLTKHFKRYDYDKNGYLDRDEYLTEKHLELPSHCIGKTGADWDWIDARVKQQK